MDQDEGTNGEVWYTIIKGNENESFSLNRETGILYPAAALLGRAGSYRIEVEARDGAGSGPHSDKCYVDIRVTPVNQHKPQFVMPELTNATVEVPEVYNNICKIILLNEIHGQNKFLKVDIKMDKI